jgi:putative flippase GtrA
MVGDAGRAHRAGPMTGGERWASAIAGRTTEMTRPSYVALGVRLDALETHAVVGRPVRFLRRRSQVALYLIVGGWNTVFAYAEWALLQFLLGDHVHYLVILVLAWPVAVLNAYVCYRRFVFRSSDSVLRELPRFSLVYVATLLGSLLALPFLLSALPLSIYAIQAGYTFTVVILSYLGHRFFSFSNPLGSTRSRDHEGDDLARR